jgi:hypothetical protein
MHHFDKRERCSKASATKSRLYGCTFIYLADEFPDVDRLWRMAPVNQAVPISCDADRRWDPTPNNTLRWEMTKS